LILESVSVLAHFFFPPGCHFNLFLRDVRFPPVFSPSFGLAERLLLPEAAFFFQEAPVTVLQEGLTGVLAAFSPLFFRFF